MTIKINFKDEMEAYSYMGVQLEELDYIIDDFIKIDYGLQFRVTKNAKKGLIRIFHSKKKGTSLDLSQVKDKVIERDVLVVIGLTNEGENNVNEDKKFNFHSLCVGINKFQNEYFQNLKYAKNDAFELNKLIGGKFKKSDTRI